MHILLVSATPFECAPFLERAAREPTSGHRIEPVVTGVGQVSATYALLARLAAGKPDLVLQAGIAGSFREADIGDTYVVEKERAGDLGAEEPGGFRTVFDLGLALPDAPPFADGTLVNPHSDWIALTGCEPVAAVTVNEITTDPKRIGWLNQRFSPVVESMEGFALHYVCLRQQVPFLQLRTVSNAVGERDKRRWRLREAVDNLNETLTAFFQKLPHGH